ncbi:MAG: CopG family transcriptional regulator [Betaproteobacteria bacterium]|nr:CopG family transcriptional regulator [Betaproteobacteria bacterium]
MHAEKLSISLPESSARFIEEYQAKHALKSRSEVIELAIRLLRERELESAYRLAAREADSGYEVTASDGLADETW